MAHALNLLGGVLERDDLPLGARLDITEVLADLLDVRPPYPPTTPDRAAATPTNRSWTDVLAQAVAALRDPELERSTHLSPSDAIGYAVAARRLRETIERPTQDSA